MTMVLARLAYEIYDAVGDGSAWERVLREIGGACGALLPALMVSERHTDRPLFALGPKADDESFRAYDAHYRSLDLRRPRIQALTAGTVFVGHELLPDAELERSEFYQDFLRPRGLYHVAGAVVRKDDDQLAVLRLSRPRDAGAFWRPQVGILRRLLPHLARALRLHQELVHARTGAGTMDAVLARFPGGVILLDGHGRVIAMNPAAEHLLAGGDGLTVRHGRLGAWSAADAASLAALIRAAAAANGTDGAMAVTRRSGERPLLVRIDPLPSGAGLDPSGRAAAIVLVTDPEDRAVPPAALLCRWFGVTSAEARVALRIAQGKDVPEVARELGIEPETARTQLKRVFVKTRTHRQADLVRLVLSVTTREGDGEQAIPPGTRQVANR